MTGLKAKLKTLIEAGGPLPVSAYMNTCLHDPEFGYYATRPGIGRDFITAPEISQVFGELLGLWSLHEWQALGAPDPFDLIEVGAGRGTMMDDAGDCPRRRRRALSPLHQRGKPGLCGRPESAAL